jgi:deoxyribose-phosphate aldolase
MRGIDRAPRSGYIAGMNAYLPITDAGRRIAPLIDHTLLKPDARREEIERLCAEARHYAFAAVCVFPAWLSLAVDHLEGSDVHPGAVVGFPFGANLTETKVFEAHQAIRDGARDIDMVLALWALKDRRYRAVSSDISAVVRVVGARGRVKVILETGLLTDEEKAAACKIAVEAGAHFVKTSTGLAGGGATEADVRLMRLTVGDRAGVKASGGIRTLAQAEALIRAGANRLGTSSGVAIVTESPPAASRV